MDNLISSKNTSVNISYDDAGVTTVHRDLSAGLGVTKIGSSSVLLFNCCTTFKEKEMLNS